METDPRLGFKNTTPKQCAVSGNPIRPDSTTVRYHLSGDAYYRVLAKYQHQWTEKLHKELLALVEGKASAPKAASKKSEDVNHDD